MTFRRTLLKALPIFAACTAAHAAQPTLTTLYSFAGPPIDGANPYAGVAIGPNGVLYGTTQWGGAEACPGFTAAAPGKAVTVPCLN
jgi:hypothetical protein